MTQTVKTPAKLQSIDTVYALSQSDVYNNLPFYGAISRILPGGERQYIEYIEKTERVTLKEFIHRKDKRLTGSYIIETRTPEEEAISITIHLGSSDAKQSESVSPLPVGNATSPLEFHSNDPVRQQLQAEVLRLQGLLSDSERKRTEVSDDHFKLKKEVSDGNTEKMLQHQSDITTLKEAHAKEVKTLEKEVSELKTEMRFKELEHASSGGVDIGTRLFNFAEKNLPDFISGLTQMINAQKENAPISEEFLQQAVQQQAMQLQQQQANEAAGHATDHPQASGPAGQNGPTVAQNPNTTQQQVQPGGQLGHPGSSSIPGGGSRSVDQPQASTEQHAEQPADAQNQQSKEAQMQSLQNHLIDHALLALTNQHTDLQKYADHVRSQLQLSAQQGINLGAREWVQMAQILADRAIQEEITAERVAAVIQPAMDSVKQYAYLLKMLDPATVTDTLFKQFNITANQQVKNLVARVFTVLRETTNAPQS